MGVIRTARVGRRRVYIAVEEGRVYVAVAPTRTERALRGLRRWWDASWASWVVEGTAWGSIGLCIAWLYGIVMEYPQSRGTAEAGTALVVILCVGAAVRWRQGLREWRLRRPA